MNHSSDPAAAALLEEMTWTQCSELSRCGEDLGPVLVVPIGSTEQHGPHLPLGTDTMIAQELSIRLALRQRKVTVAPAIAYGSAGEHGAFFGTLSIGREALEHLVIELVRSACAFSGVVLVSGHGGNAVALANAQQRLRNEGRRVLVWFPTTEVIARAAPAQDGAGIRAPDLHGGWVETSLMLAIAPGLVHMQWAVAGNTRPISEIEPALLSRGVGAVSPNGVLGDPSGASAELGRKLFEQLAEDLACCVGAWVRAWSGQDGKATA